MPPSPRSAYFPPLDKCLTGDERLISWRTAYRSLSNPAYSGISALQSFLSDAESHNYLTNAHDPYLQPGSKTKSDFEAKTAPIHVAQCSNGDYDLEELKKDARWLSEQVNVEELVALRCVVLEWQQRAEDQLLASLAGSGSAVGGSELGASMLGASTTGFGASIIGNTATNEAGREETRRRRQLQLFLEEKSHILKVAVLLVNRAAVRDGASTGRSWVDDVASGLVEDMCSPTNRTAYEGFLSTCIENVEKVIRTADDSSKWPRIFTTDEAKQEMFASACFTDAASTMQLLLAILHLSPGAYIPSSSLVQAWYDLMKNVGFFANLAPSPAVPDPSAIQALASLVSLSILCLPAAILNIQDTASQLLGGVSSSIEDATRGVSYPDLRQNGTGSQLYINNDTCLREVNLTLHRAASPNGPLFLASPAIFAWSLLTSNIRDIAKLYQDAREQRRGGEDGDGSSPLARRTSREDMSTFEQQYALLQTLELDTEAQDDPPGYIARVAVDEMGVFGIMLELASTAATIWDADMAFVARSTLFELVREGMAIVSYSADVLRAVLSILAPAPASILTRELEETNLDGRLADRLLDSADMQLAVLSQAVARYPFELSPLLSLLTALATGSTKQAIGPTKLVKLLDTMPSLTLMVDQWFRAYQLENEDDNENNIALTEDLPLFISKQYERGFFAGGASKAITMGSGEDDTATNVLTIPAGTSGVVLKETRPLVLRLEHPHSALEYLGLLLSTILPTCELLPAPPMDADLDHSTAADIITLITALLKASLHQHSGVDESRHLLGRLSYALPEGQDIISVISDILETELLAHLDQSASEGSLNVLVACVEITYVLVSISPDRVWGSLHRSCLLGLAGGANALTAVVGGSEVPSGSFRFLTACVMLYGLLVHDAITGLVKRKPRTSKQSRGRFDSPMADQDVTSARTISAVLVAFQTVMADVWVGVGEWRFQRRGERSGIWMSLAALFEALLKAAYGVGEGKGVTTLLVPAAKMVVDGFGGQEGAVKSFGRLFGEGVGVEEAGLTSRERLCVVEQIGTAASFLTTLIRTTRMIDAETEVVNRAGALGRQLTKLMPAFAALMATDPAYKGCLSLLLAEVVQASNIITRASSSTNGSNETPSLLGQVSAEAGKQFLTVLSHLDRPLRALEAESSIWSFLAGVMESKQQWFAVYLLTGSLPRHRLNELTAPNGHKSLLTYALDQLSSLPTLEPDRAIGMLRFVSTCQTASPWATSQVRSHDTFLKNAVEWLSTLQPPNKKGATAQERLAISELRTAALLCSILAVGVHAGAEVGDRTVLKLLSPKLRFLVEEAGRVDTWNRSLHTKLEENFRRKFGGSGIEVVDFRSTKTGRRKSGDDEEEYDVEFADQVLGHEVAWLGLGGREKGFKEEFARANVNLALVGAQRELLSAWRALAATLSGCLGTGQKQENEELAQGLIKAVDRCLTANADPATDMDVPAMHEVVEIRAEMAFAILSRLVALRVEDDGMKGLLFTAFDVVMKVGGDYAVATAQEGVGYWRTALQVLYLAIQPHVYMASGHSTRSTNGTSSTAETKAEFLDPAVAGVLVEIVAKVVAPGFRALCGNLHTSIDMAQPADFALLTAILRAVLSVKGIEAVHAQIAEAVASSSVVRGALSLYSWSDRLAENMSGDGEQDPIYGELSILFLVALSTVPTVAEQMALSGVLAQLASANLSNYFRKPNGKSPFDEPRRMFAIWSEGFLPLALNLLDAVGAPVAADVATFLNSFPPQLQRAEMALENRVPSVRHPHAGAVTLGLVSEAHNLCLVAHLLSVLVAHAADAGIDANDIPALLFDAVKVREDVVGLARQRTSLASRIVAVGEREEVWARTSAGGTDNVLLAKVVREIEGVVAWGGDEGGTQ